MITAGLLDEIFNHGEVARRRLLGQLAELAFDTGFVGDELAINHRGEGAQSHDRLGRLLTVALDDGGVEAHHLAQLGHLTLHLEPKLFQLGDRGQPFGFGKVTQEFHAFGAQLGRDHGVLSGGVNIARHLTHHTEHLAQRTGLIGQRGLEFGERLFVLIEGGRQLVSPALQCCQFGLGLLQQRGLLIALTAELLDPTFVFFVLCRASCAGLLQQLIQRLGLRTNMGRREHAGSADQAGGHASNLTVH